jgi:hypothetical protein
MGGKGRGVDVQLHSFLNSTVDGVEKATACPDRFARVRGSKGACHLLNKKLGGP